jgi:hypothetical protein
MQPAFGKAARCSGAGGQRQPQAFPGTARLPVNVPPHGLSRHTDGKDAGRAER